MWAFARYDLGLAEAEFWRMTPRLLDALRIRAELEVERADARAGLVASMIFNMTPKKSKKVLTVADFLPKRKRKRKRRTWQELLGLVRQTNAALGGKVLEKSGADGAAEGDRVVDALHGGDAAAGALDADGAIAKDPA